MNERKRRIAFIIGGMSRGGAERVISILANDYANRGWAVDIIMLLNNRCEYELHNQINLIPIIGPFRNRIAQLPTWISGIRQYLLVNQPDFVVSFIARVNIVTILSCFGYRGRLIVSERNDPRNDGRSCIVRLATYVLYKCVDRVIFQTEWAKSCFPGKIRDKSVIIPNPIDVLVEALPDKKRKIVAVGRLAEQKNHLMLIQAFKKFIQSCPEYTLHIYGDGVLRERLEEEIKSLGLQDFAFLEGAVDDVHQRIADAQMFVLSSNYEGMSNALLEAMLMGLPCISTRCAGSIEVIKDGYNGLLVDIGDVEGLTKAMMMVAGDTGLAQQLGRCAKKSVTGMRREAIVSLWRSAIEN